jgi:hypothetical protein
MRPGPSPKNFAGAFRYGVEIKGGGLCGFGTAQRLCHSYGYVGLSQIVSLPSVCLRPIQCPNPSGAKSSARGQL